MIYIYITLGVAVLVITILALIGLKVKKQAKKIKEQLGLEKSTTKDELDKAIAKFKFTQRQKQFKDERDKWLKSKGYSVRYNSVEKEELKIIREKHSSWRKPISSYVSMVRRFMKLKHEKKIKIYYMVHDKFGIPYYEMRKTVAQQIRGIE